MKQSSGVKDLSEYIFTRPEMAKLLNISTNALRMRMRKGSADGLEYARINGKFMFKRPRVDKDARPGARSHLSLATRPLSRATGSRKKATRGNHHEAKYPNRFFKEHNARKMLKKLNETDPDFIKNYQKYKEIHQREKQQEIFRNTLLTVKNYGGFIRGATPFIVKHSTGFKALVPEEKDEYEKALDEAKADGKGTGKYYW